MATIWTVQLLGRLQVRRDDLAITRFQTRQAGALLAYLAFYRRRPHPREYLAELCWPDDPPEVRRRKLRVALSALRRQLEPPGDLPGTVIVATRLEVQLNAAHVTTDVAAFEAALQTAAAASGAARWLHLQEAVRRYEGELLPGFPEEWVIPERQRLLEAYLQTLTELTRYLETTSDRTGAIHWARRRVKSEPLDEEGHQELIRLLLEDGQRDAALRHYRELERLLQQELGLTAGEDLRELLSAPARGPSTPIEKQPQPGAREGLRAAGPTSGATITLLAVELALAPAAEPGPATAGGAGDGGLVEALRNVCHRCGGMGIPSSGAAMVFAFEGAASALGAALEAEAIGRTEPEDVRCGPGRAPRWRQALHTGDVEQRTAGWHGATLQHALRLLQAARPGQILLSEAATAVLRPGLPEALRLVDLGAYRLEGAAAPERLFQLANEESDQPLPPAPAAEPAYAQRLPSPLNRFFDREAELEQVRGWLVDAGRRLVTLTGPGGSGKSRLALEAAHRLQDPWHGAIWWVPLAQLSDPQLLPGALRDALRLPHSPHLDPQRQLLDALARQPSLLVLDNLEQLLPEGALPIKALLEGIASLTCLVTSRRCLELDGEYELPVTPLPVPVIEPSLLIVDQAECRKNTSRPSTIHHQLSTLARCPSVQLFVDRAQAVEPHFQITPGNAAAVTQLCQQLEGLPLALELAAARASAMGPGAMLAGLSQRFEFLISRRRDIAPRHRSLWAALDWSYQLLPPALQRFFARLSVFRGGWSVGAAEAVCAEGRASEYLEELRASSLVGADVGEVETRYQMLESLREYAAERLSPEERAQGERRHARFYLRLAEETEPQLTGPDQVEWFERLENEHDNLRAALAWAARTGSGEATDRSAAEEQVSAAELGLRLGAALWWFWSVRGHRREGQAQLARLLALPGAQAPTAFRAKALNRAGSMAAALNDNATALPLIQESLMIRRGLGDRLSLTGPLNNLGHLAGAAGDFAAAQAYHEECHSMYQEFGNQWGAAMSAANLGTMLYYQGKNQCARAHLEESLALMRALHDQWHTAFALTNLGLIALAQADYTRARCHYKEALALLQLVDRGALMIECMEGLAAVVEAAGQPEPGARLFGAARTLRDALGCPPLPDHPTYERNLPAARALEAERASVDAWREGYSWTVEQAIAYAAGVVQSP